MIKEFGIDPAVLDSAESFYRIMGLFGIEHFRLIRDFPVNWATRVKKAVRNVKPKQKLRLFEDLEKIEEGLIKCTYQNGNLTFSYDDSNDWFYNAQKYHVINPFDGMVCDKNPSRSHYICRSEELNSDSEILDCPTTINRTSVEIAKSVKTIFLYADEIHLVDPIFATVKAQFIRPLKEMISFFEKRKGMGIKNPSRFIYHTSEDHTGDSFIESKLNMEISGNLILPLRLEIIRWPAAELHNRMVLSDIGGVIFGTGLDDTEDLAISEIDTIKPLTKFDAKNIQGRLSTSEKYMETTKKPIVTILGRKSI